jgi:hypothetical protein
MVLSITLLLAAPGLALDSIPGCSKLNDLGNEMHLEIGF